MVRQSLQKGLTTPSFLWAISSQHSFYDYNTVTTVCALVVPGAILKEHMGTRFALILVLIVSAVVPAAAQSVMGLAPLVGCYKAQNADGLRLLGGAAFRFRFSEILGVEASINYRGEEYSNGSVEVKSWPVMVTGLLYPIPAVYGAIGAGWYNTFVSYNVPSEFPGGPASISRESKQQFGWHFGGGVELPVYSYVKLIGDIRYVFLNQNFRGFPGSSVVNSNSPIVTAGLLFSL